MIEEVLTKKQLREFIDFPHELYQGDPNYVPELYVGQKELLWKADNHPFFDHSEMRLYLARRAGKTVGRIAAILNNNHIEYVRQPEGFFGFFDCENVQETANELLNQASKWLRSQQLTRICGPINQSTNNTCGLLVEGYDTPPVVMMPYNAPYYQELLEKWGLAKKVDLMAYEVYKGNTDSKALNLMDRLLSRLESKGIVVRSINTRDFDNEVRKIRTVYNKAWDKNLGFVPMTENEFKVTAKELKMILDPRFGLVAEKDGEIIGFAIGIPDINQIQIDMPKGRLLPTGIFKLLFRKSKITTLRVMMLGVVEEYRKLGIEACLYGKIIRNAEGTPIIKAECSWMLEHNYLMNHAIEQINGKAYKRYRIFEKAI
jgi:GNAT superfamily N-acetyltransferase